MIKDLFYKNFNEIKNDFDWMKDLKPFFINKIKPNLSFLLVHLMQYDFKLKITYTRSCLKNCNICPLINSKPYIKLGNLWLPMLCNANCETTNLVYIVQCIKCDMFYIGETSKSLLIRINQHLNAIKRFIPYFKKENEIAVHFRSVGHNIPNDFRVCVFRDNLIDTTIRRSVEMDLILLFKNVFNFEILNSKIYNYNFLNKLCFI